MHNYDPPAPSALERVRDLTEHLADLARRVRAAVAEAVAETLSRIARDAADRLLRPPAAEPVRERYSGRYEEVDPWDDSSPARPENPTMNASTDRDSNRTALGQAIAAGLAAAGWWARRGSPLAALGAGVTVAAAVASGGYLGRTGRAVIGAMSDLLTLAGPLARGATRSSSP
jgi:hypothetical protein